MRLRTKDSWKLLLLFPTFLFSESGFCADKVVLKSGVTLSGECVPNQKGLLPDVKTEKTVSFDLGTKQLNIPSSEINKLNIVVEERVNIIKRKEAIDVKDAKKLFELAMKLKSEHFYYSSKQLLDASIKADPAFEKARVEAGHIQFENNWYSADELNALSAKRQKEAEERERKEKEAEQKLRTAKQYALVKETLKMAETLGSESSDAKVKEKILQSMKEKSALVSPILAEALDHRNVENIDTRVGALAVISYAGDKTNRVGKMLAHSAVYDPEPKIRTRSAEIIKERDDRVGMGSLLKTMYGTYSSSSGDLKDEEANAKAAAALRLIDDTKVYNDLYEILRYYVLMEVRATQVELAGFQTRQIDSFTVNSGANANLVLQLSFPIQFPELRINKVRTTVMVPASVLRSVSQQAIADDDLAGWRNWIKNRNK